MGGGNQHAQLPSVTMPNQCRTVGADRIHYRADIVHPFLQRWQVLDRVRQPNPTHLEEDQPPGRCCIWTIRGRVKLGPLSLDQIAKARSSNATVSRWPTG